MSKEVVKKETQALVANQGVNIGDVMTDMGMSAEDILIPKLLMAQGTSRVVGEEKAKLGDWTHSISGEKIAGFEEMIEIIPLRLYKTWIKLDVTQGTPKFLGEEPALSQKERKWEELDGASKIRNYYTYNFYALLMKDVEAGYALPVVISFKSSSMLTGKKLASQMAFLGASGKPVFSETVMLYSKKEKKDTNFYGVARFTAGRKLSALENGPKYLELAAQWSANVRGIDSSKVHDADAVQVEDVVHAASPMVKESQDQF